jgi:sigma-B regulation protein RsbU (phosphoserine phosphatase)
MTAEFTGTAELTIIDPSGHRTRMKLEPVPFRIGRQAGNQLVMRDSRTSRVHAQILLENSAYVIEDMQSRHGLYVNGARVTRHQLQAADRIEFGVPDSFQIIFEPAAAPKPVVSLSATAASVAAPIPDGEAATELGKLRAMLDVARAVQSSFGLEEILASVVRAALTITHAERGFLLLRGKGGLQVRCALDRSGRHLRDDDLRVPLTFINRSLEKRRELLSMIFDPTAATDDLNPGETVVELELRSAVCIPLLKMRQNDPSATSVMSAASNTAGVLYLDSRSRREDMAEGNRELLQTLALEASTILENARLMEEERHKQRFEQELDLARTIQQSLLPAELPQTGWFRAAGLSIPSYQVGGDYFDVMHTGPQTWAVVVADVAGKGVSSALLASLLQGAFLTLSDQATELQSTMLRVSNVLYERTGGGKYATMFSCLCTEDGTLTYVNAGHCAPIVIVPGEPVTYLDTTSMPVGLVPDADFELHQHRLKPGAKVVIYTDGVTEAQDAEGRFFGKKLLRQVIAKHAARPCAELQNAIREAVDEFTGQAPQSDDVTLVTLEYAPDEQR